MAAVEQPQKADAARVIAGEGRPRLLDVVIDLPVAAVFAAAAAPAHKGSHVRRGIVQKQADQLVSAAPGFGIHRAALYRGAIFLRSAGVAGAYEPHLFFYLL